MFQQNKAEGERLGYRDVEIDNIPHSVILGPLTLEIIWGPVQIYKTK